MLSALIVIAGLWAAVLLAIPKFTYVKEAVQTTASTALSNTTTATTFDKQASIPANSLKVGDRIRIKFQGIATATNSTDTLAIAVKIGATTILSLTAVDVADNNIFIGDMEVQIRTIGASGTCVGMGWSPAIGATAGAVLSRHLASTAIDTTADNVVGVVGTWSVASSSNSCRLDYFSCDIIPSVV